MHTHPDLMTFLATVDVQSAWVQFLPAIIAAISALVGSRGGSGSGTSDPNSPSPGVSSQTTDSNMTAILDTMRRRMDMQNPLYEAVQRLAMGLMPTAYQTGNTHLGTVGESGPGGGGPGQENPASNTPWGNPPSYPGGASDSFSFTPEGLRQLPRQRLPPA